VLKALRGAAAVALLVMTSCAVHAKKPDKEGRMLEEGLALLDKGDTRSICAGAEKLGRLGRAEAIEPLLGHLKTRDETARECVREALAKLEVAPVLTAWWHSNDVAQQERALELASMLPHPELMPLLREAAVAPEAPRRKRVAIGLKRQAESPEVFALLATLLADTNRDVRWWAIDTLSLSKNPEAARILRERSAAEGDADLRKLIARALGEPE